MLNGTRSDLNDWKRQVLGRLRPYLDRREFLQAAAVGSAALAGAAFRPGRAVAGAKAVKAVKTGTFSFPRLLFHVKDETKDIWNAYPIADVILRRRLEQLTNINVNQNPVVVQLADLEKLCRYPFVFATSEGYFDLPKNEEANLREFLMRGGFVHADDCVLGHTGDRFFRDYVKMVKRLFPDHEMERVPDDHEIYHCYFDLPKGSPFLQGKDHGGWGLFEKGTGRIMTFVTPGDLHCGWTFQFFTPAKNEAAVKMGVNIIIYYLTH